MKAVVVASGDLADADLRELADADVVVAADGGAAVLQPAGHPIDLLVGDLDSATPALVARLEAAGTRVERHPIDKGASDTELALRAAIEAGATEVVVLAATGGERLDHELANVLLLADPALAAVDVRLLRGDTVVRVVRGGESLAIDVPPGGIVSLLPIGGDAAGVSTAGLRWALDRATLRVGPTRGLSNRVIGRPAAVRIERGTLLVIETVDRTDRKDIP